MHTREGIAEFMPGFRVLKFTTIDRFLRVVVWVSVVVGGSQLCLSFSVIMVLFSAGMMQWFCVVTSSGSSLSREDKIAHQVLLILVLEAKCCIDMSLVLYRCMLSLVLEVAAGMKLI